MHAGKDMLPANDVMEASASERCRVVWWGTMQAGFFPTYTLGEDMALALEIQKAGWKGAYVKEYLAVGEVPETVRNAFMQKSRWCKGGMQIFFSHHNAMLATNISFMQKVSD